MEENSKNGIKHTALKSTKLSKITKMNKTSKHTERCDAHGRKKHPNTSTQCPYPFWSGLVVWKAKNQNSRSKWWTRWGNECHQPRQRWTNEFFSLGKNEYFFSIIENSEQIKLKLNETDTLRSVERAEKSWKWKPEPNTLSISAQNEVNDKKRVEKKRTVWSNIW